MQAGHGLEFRRKLILEQQQLPVGIHEFRCPRCHALLEFHADTFLLALAQRLVQCDCRLIDGNSQHQHLDFRRKVATRRRDDQGADAALQVETKWNDRDPAWAHADSAP